MAALPLTANQQEAFAQLLSSLEPNIQPAEPTAWPLAMGYWFVLIFTLILIGITIYWWVNAKHARVFKKQLHRLKSLTDPHEQLKEAHLYLRWFIKEQKLANAGLSPEAFKRYVASLNNGEAPVWLNQHYQQKPASHIDWNEFKHIARKLHREAKR